MSPTYQPLQSFTAWDYQHLQTNLALRMLQYILKLDGEALIPESPSLTLASAFEVDELGIVWLR